MHKEHSEKKKGADRCR